MQGYASGAQPLDNRTIKLNTNENPYPASSDIADVLEEFSVEHLRRYPQPTADAFRKIAAKLHGVAQKNIIATRGGDELLRLVITSFVDPGETIGMTDPTYSLYPVLAQIQNCPIYTLPLEDDWTLSADFGERMNAANVKLTLLVNPHAPSGNLVPAARLEALANQLNSLLLIDEAYIDFVEGGESALNLVKTHENVIVLRTLSKGYSLAGLRFGYGVAAQSLIDPMLNKTRDSYNLDAISQRIAEVALSDQNHALENCRKVIAERNLLAATLRSMGMESPPSQANFLLVSVPALGISAPSLQQALSDKGVLVRYFDHPRLADKLRISIGTPTENATLVAAIKDILTLP